MSRFTRLLAALPIAALSLGALAQSTDPTGAPTRAFEHLLKKMDSNGDGKISVDEFLAAAGARFDAIDAQHSGHLDAQQLAHSPQAAERIEHHAQALVEHLDKAGNGYVTEAEFTAAAQKRFARLDKNGDGKLTLDELAAHGAATGAHAQERAQKHLDRLDANHDGAVSLAEYVAAASAKYRELDTQGTGKLTAAQIAASPKAQERAERVAAHIVKHIDSNGDGVVSRDEYLAAARHRFERMDKNGDGFIEADEVPARHWARGHGADAG